MEKKSTSDNKWRFQGKPLLNPPEGAYGFVYRVSWDDGYYIGAKCFYNNTTVRLSKKKSNELYTGKGRKPTKETKTKNSNWKIYKSSSKELQQLVNERGVDNFTWEILELAKNKSELAYKETQMIICNDVLLDPKCLNAWVTTKIHKKNLQ